MSQEAKRVQIGERLREDALGDWHRAERAGERFTLRILREDLIGREDALRLFEEEVRRVARLDHPALLGVHHVQRTPPRPWMLTDPIDGPNLETTVRDTGPLASAEALALVTSVAGAFAYLEGRRQVHAAPLPGRLVRYGAGWRLLTFRDIRAWDELTSRKGKTFPQPRFAPPEQARAHPERLRPPAFQAWGLGALLRFAAGGGPPRTAGGEAAPLPATFPAELVAAVTALLAWEPDGRPQGQAALARVLGGQGLGDSDGPAPRSHAVAPIPKRKRRPGRSGR